MILAVDPGGTTGVAIDGPTSAPWTKQIDGGADGFYHWFDGLRDGSLPDVIVCESFIPRPGARSMQLDALYIIGYLKGWCLLNQVPFVLQSPAQAKSFSTDIKLRAAGWWVPGQDHARDALRHLMVYTVKQDPHGELAYKIARGVL